MSFAQEFLNISTNCYEAVKEIYSPTKVYQFFGQECGFDIEAPSNIVMHSVEEWESTLRATYTNSSNEEILHIEFETWNDILLNPDHLNDENDIEKFFISLFKWEFKKSKVVDDDLNIINRPLLEEIFASFDKSTLGLFVACYVTALDEQLVRKYRKQYNVLKEQYPGLPFYPDFQFQNELTDYYEASTC